MRKISPPTAIRSPDRPTRSQSLYRLRYTAHSAYLAFVIKAVSYYISTVVLCESGDWSHISREEHRLRGFQGNDVEEDILEYEGRGKGRMEKTT